MHTLKTNSHQFSSSYLRLTSALNGREGTTSVPASFLGLECSLQCCCWRGGLPGHNVPRTNMKCALCLCVFNFHDTCEVMREAPAYQFLSCLNATPHSGRWPVIMCTCIWMGHTWRWKSLLKAYPEGTRYGAMHGSVVGVQVWGNIVFVFLLR